MNSYIVTEESFRRECDQLNRNCGVLRAERDRMGWAWAGGRECAGARALTPSAPARFCLSAVGHGESVISTVRERGRPGRRAELRRRGGEVMHACPLARLAFSF